MPDTTATPKTKVKTKTERPRLHKVILVNNRSEGCAPLTIRALARELGIPYREAEKPKTLFD